MASLGRFELDQPVTMMVGGNAAGESTLIEAIAILAGFNPEGGADSALSPSRQLAFLRRMS